MGVLLVAGCGSSPPPPAPAPRIETRPKREAASAPQILAEIGALDEAAVKRAFRAALPAVDRCLAQGRAALPFLEGEIEIFLRIAQDGSVRWAYPRRSSLGDSGTERCILEALGAQRWPEPQGGQNGETTQSFAIDSEERPAVGWTPGDLGPAAAELGRKLAECRAQSGTARLEVTLHVDPEGKALAAGAAVGDERGRQAIGCAVEAATSLTYPSPGSYPAKVTVAAE